MAKQAYVYSGTDWVPLASEVTNLSNYYTKGEIDILDAPTGLKLLVPTSVAVGSGSGSVDAIGNVTFSSASSISLNGCFTSAYNNYVIVANLSGSVNDSDNNFRFRASGTDNTSAIYQATVCGAFNSAGNFVSQTAATNIFTLPGTGQTGTFSNWTINVYKPYSTDAWKQVTGVGGYKHSSVNTITRTVNGYINSATQFDGFSFIGAGSNQFTGTVRVYGYKD